MKLGSFDLLVQALDKAGVRYLVAGGLAVNAHGYLRFTREVDLVLHLSPQNILAAFAAPKTIGYRPLVPVTADDFANPAQREQWIRTYSSASRSTSTKNMSGRWPYRSAVLPSVSSPSPR